MSMVKSMINARRRVFRALLAGAVLCAGLFSAGLACAQTKFTPVSAADSGHVTIHSAANTLDGNLTTRWLAEGQGLYAQYDLGQNRTLGQVKIAFDVLKSYPFDIMVSTNGTGFSSAGGTRSGSGKTLDFQTFAVSATGRYVRIVTRGPWFAATEVQFFGTSTTTPPPPPPPATTAGLKWHPGHYVWPDGKMADSPDNRAYHFSFFDSIGNEQNVEGVQLIVYWSSLENDTPGDYSNGFAMIDAYLAKLASLPRPKRLILGLQERTFGAPAPDLKLYYPGYVVDKGWVDVKQPDSTLAGGLHDTAMFWKPEVMDRIVALTKAYAARYDKHPMVEMFMLGETSVLSPSGAGGYSTGGYAAQMKRWCDAGKTAWAHTQLRLVANFHGNDSQMRSLIDSCAAGGGVAVGGPDPELPLPDISRTIQSNRVFRGDDGGADMRGKYPWVAEQQGMGLGSRYTQTPAGIFTYQTGTMRASYMIWLRNTYLGGADQRWSTGILPYIRATTLKVRTACPTAYGARCDSR